jgi:HPt (histidine-containing phosphotransfer) domain-containing protein
VQSESELLTALKDLAADVGSEGVAEILDLFLTDSAELVGVLRHAAERGDAAGIARAAHSLKSTAATVGAHLLAEHCLEVERLGRAGLASEAGVRVADVDAEYQHVRTSLTALRPRIHPANV